MDSSELPFTLAEVDEEILEYQRLLASSPRSDPHRPFRLQQLGALRNNRYELSHQKGDLDKSITHHTEAFFRVLPFQASQDLVHMFFELATVLLSRFNFYKQPEDLKSSLEYFRYLRINFHPLEAFGISHGDLTPRLVDALAQSLMLGSGDMMQEMEEMVDFFPEFLASDLSKDVLVPLIEAFANFVTNPETEMFHRRGTQQVFDRVIQVLREATVLKPDLDVNYALAKCLTVRFTTTHDLNDYEEAIPITEKILATHSSGDSLTAMHIETISLAALLLWARLNSYPKPEYLEDAIHRFRTFPSLPSLPDRHRIALAGIMDFFAAQRFTYFGVAENSGETPYPPSDISRTHPVSARPGSINDIQVKMDRLSANKAKILNDKATVTDVEAAVELSRKFIPLRKPLWQSSNDWSFLLTLAFAGNLRHAHDRTNRLDYLNEAILLYRDLREVQRVHFRAGFCLLQALKRHFKLLRHPQDLEEAMPANV